MSHWTTVKTTYKNERAIEKAIHRLFPKIRLRLHEKIRGYQGESRPMEIVALDPGENSRRAYDLGFQLEADGTYSMHTDYYGSARWLGRQADFEKKFKQAYAAEVSIMEAKKMGYHVNEKTVDGKIRLSLTSF